MSAIRISLQHNSNARVMPSRVPAPSHRHAAPSAPWPWIDLDSDVDLSQLDPSDRQGVSSCSHPEGQCTDCWTGYPQSLFPNWKFEQQRRSGILSALKTNDESKPCVIHCMDVVRDGTFIIRESLEISNEEVAWKRMQSKKRPLDTRVRALFIESMSGVALRMLGTRYNIEPFFFTSALNWIPSRYQEEPRPNEGDHITIVLKFVRSFPDHPMTAPPSPSLYHASHSSSSSPTEHEEDNEIIDTQAPLLLRSTDTLLLPDLLAVHLVRSCGESTLISYHPPPEFHTTSAKQLHARIAFAGRSVYWQKIFQQSNDPTFLLLTFLWHALYAWDEALENLYAHICWLESRVITTNDMRMTQELHIVRAHLLHYSSLLSDFRKSVVFVLQTPNPAMNEIDEIRDEEWRHNMTKECQNLLSEIERLEKDRSMQDSRLKNVMDLAFSLVNIEDSRRTQRLTEATVRDSAAMKQISILTMIFLPASLVASIFGMNVEEINPGTLGTIPHYVITAAALTVFTIWLIVALNFQSEAVVMKESGEEGLGGQTLSMWTGFFWPIIVASRIVRQRRQRRQRWRGSMNVLFGPGVRRNT